MHSEKNKQQILNEMPIIAILRGVELKQVINIATELVCAGIRIIEIPLNSPDALEGIQLLRKNFGDHVICGAGTVLTSDDISELQKIEAEIAISPNTNISIIQESLVSNMIPVPGFVTPSEALAAINAGAKYLKLFPANFYGPQYLKSIKVVLPSNVSVFAVGGITPRNMETWLQAGACGFGIASALYRPGFTPSQVAEMAKEVVTAFRKAR